MDCSSSTNTTQRLLRSKNFSFCTISRGSSVLLLLSSESVPAFTQTLDDVGKDWFHRRFDNIQPCMPRCCDNNRKAVTGVPTDTFPNTIAHNSTVHDATMSIQHCRRRRLDATVDSIIIIIMSIRYVACTFGLVCGQSVLARTTRCITDYCDMVLSHFFRLVWKRC